MAEVNVTIGTQGDVSGIKQIETGYQNMLNRAKQAYRTMQARSPMEIAGDKQSHEMKMNELDRKARDIDRKLMSTKLRMAEGTLPGSGTQRVERLQTEALRVNYQRSILGDQQRDIAASRDARGRAFAPIIGAGRFGLGKALRFGGMAAGAVGAYSLLSGIFGEMGGVEERNLAYATALSTTRGRRAPGSEGLDYTAINQPFFMVKQMLKDLGDTAYITSKDMAPMLEVAKELGDLSGRMAGTAGATLAQVANIGKLLGVAPGVPAEFMTQGIRFGGFGGAGQATDTAKMIMTNQNMMHRATESLQAMQQVMTGTMHGTQQLGSFGIFNLLDVMNLRGPAGYRGAGGASALLRIDQAFRQGGDENLQYMQTLALNPAFQRRNAQMAIMSKGAATRETNWDSGHYDQLITDLYKSLGAFATPEDLITSARGMGLIKEGEGKDPLERYIRKMYGGETGAGMKTMGIQRLMGVAGGVFGAGQSTGRQMLMQMQLAKSMGISPADIGVMGEALQDTEFMRRMAAGGFKQEDIVARFKEFKSAGKDMPEFNKLMTARAESERRNVETAKRFQAAREKFMTVFAKEAVTNAIVSIADSLPALATGMEKFADFFFGEKSSSPVVSANKAKPFIGSQYVMRGEPDLFSDIADLFGGNMPRSKAPITTLQNTGLLESVLTPILAPIVRMLSDEVRKGAEEGTTKGTQSGQIANPGQIEMGLR